MGNLGNIKLLINCIANDMMEPIGYIPFGLISGILYLVILHARRSFRGKNNLPKMKKVSPRAAVQKDLVHFLIIVYAGVLLKLAFFSREPGSRTGISLLPFETWGTTEIAHAFFIENILMFIPLGVLLPLASARFRKPAVCILSGLLCSTCLELMQLITQRGFCQLDDIMTNTLGTATGFVLFSAGRRLKDRFARSR